MCCKRKLKPSNCRWDLPLPNISFANININIDTSHQHHCNITATPHQKSINITTHQQHTTSTSHHDGGISPHLGSTSRSDQAA